MKAQPAALPEDFKLPATSKIVCSSLNMGNVFIGEHVTLAGDNILLRSNPHFRRVR